MKKLLQTTTRGLALVAVLAFVIALGSVSAFAQSPDSPVFRAAYPGETHSGYCCKSWEASVSVNEPEKLAPIVVTWSTDYRANTPFYAALRVNGGPCAFYGPSYLPQFSPEDGSSASKTFQWVIMPGDYKLQKGTNVITVCGGSTVFGDSGTITLGFNTLSAQLMK